MLSERITKLFQILQCSNTEIARFADCTPSNVSRLKSGLRKPGPDSRSVRRLVLGVYRYADYENMLSVLGELCGTDDLRAEAMIPAILSWLYEETDFTPPRTVQPKSKKKKEEQRRSFGERLDKVMNLLELTNSQLAAALNVDMSQISRYRSGLLYPGGNERIKESLSENLIAFAEKKGRETELAELCGMNILDLSPETFLVWLCDVEEHPTVFAEMLVRSIGLFAPGQGQFPEPPEIPPVENLERYWGTEGLRQAVIRFLEDAAREGGELLLYSDEPLDWMSGDPDYFAVWAYLMVACVRRGVHIKIIHNVDRVSTEMVSGIIGWFPLYLSGMIEPYIFRKVRNTRFYHTVFIRPGRAAILGCFPTEIREKRWYDYVLDKKQLEAMETGYGSMLKSAAPFLRIYPSDRENTFLEFCREHRNKRWVFIHYGLSIGTMPESLAERMIDRANITDAAKKELLSWCEKRRNLLRDILLDGSVDEIICLPDREDVLSGRVKMEYGIDEDIMNVTYAPEEYAEHVAAVRELVNREKKFHLTLLPQVPFGDLQVFTMEDTVVVLRCREPYAAFAFSNAVLTQSVSEYFEDLKRKYAEDRPTVMRTLDAAIQEVSVNYRKRE